MIDYCKQLEILTQEQINVWLHNFTISPETMHKYQALSKTTSFHILIYMPMPS